MSQEQRVEDLLSDAEREIKERFTTGGESTKRVPSTAHAATRETRVDQLLLPDDQRGKMPFTKSQYLKRENPQKVQWERELRKFLRLLSPSHEHRISAVMVFEWATGVTIKALMEAERAGDKRGQVTWRADLRKLNDLLKGYFGNSYMTYIMGKKVPKAYRVPKGTYIYRRRPQTLTLYAEWADGVKL